VDLGKIQVICDWIALTTLTKIWRFLGLSNFYRRLVLGFSHISSALNQVTMGSGKETFTWRKEQQQSFDDMKCHLFSAPVLSLPDLQQLFEIETYAFDYVIGAVLTQHSHPLAYHSDRLSDIIWKHPTYDKEMHSTVQACRQWKHYILGKETIIHIDHKPLQFIQTQGKLQNEFHRNWSTYLKQFHLNIKYKIGIKNCLIDCLCLPPIVSLTTILHSYGHEASEWTQIYHRDPNFATTYHLLDTCMNVTNFHFQDGLLCHLGHLCVPTSECAKLILEAYYSQIARHFGMDKIVLILLKHFYWPKLRQDFSKYIRSCTFCAISKSSINKTGL
jgi:hypothetical protein